MYIRRTKTKTAEHGEDSFTYRIVESVREGTQVKQRTLLNLGKDFAIEPTHWPLLAARIEQLLQGSAPRQAELFHLADDVGQLLEATAERYSDLIIAKLAQPVAIATPEADYHRVNINHIGGICAVTLSRFTGEKGVDISPQNKFLDDSLTPHLTIFNAGYRKKPSEPVFR